MYIITAHSDDRLLYWQGTAGFYVPRWSENPGPGSPYWTTIRECATIFPSFGDAARIFDALLMWFDPQNNRSMRYGLSLHYIRAIKDVGRSVVRDATRDTAEPVLHLERPIDLG